MKPMVSQGYTVLDGLHPMSKTVSPFKISVISAKLIGIFIYVDHAGPSGLTHDNFLLPDSLHEDIDDAGMGENIDGEVYGPTNLHQSRRIAPHVEHSKSFQNISHQPS